MATSCDYKPTCSLLVRLIFMLLFLSSYLGTIKLCLGERISVKCLETEREALLAFKEGLTDRSGRLSSWVGEDCCKWPGVECNNETGHVIILDLRNPIQSTDNWTEKYSPGLGGKINPSLLHLKYLNYLDLSYNVFEGLQIPKFFGMLHNLRYLNLSHASFAEEIPPQLGNLSNLQYLDLQTDLDLHANNLNWVSGLSSLKHLNLGNVNLTSVGIDWLQAINMLPSLVKLHLRECHLEYLPLFAPLVNLTSLVTLDLSYNHFNSLPQWLFHLTSLKELLLNQNSFWGSIPASIGNLSSLQYLDLSYNEMNGTIPESFGQLAELIDVNLSENSWEGVLTDAHLANLTRLENMKFATDPKRSLVFNVTYEWVPPFRLKTISLENCLIGPRFPVWLQVQSKLTKVFLKNVGISDSISEEWFSKLSSQVTDIDLSNNKIYGKLPPQLEFPELVSIDLSYNCFVGPLPLWSTRVTNLYLHHNLFSGPIPTNIGELMPELNYLILFENRLNGTIPPTIWNLQSLEVLSLRSNQFTGKIPQILNYLSYISIVDIANNSLFGNIPSSIGFLSELSKLMLSNNNLDGEIPSSLQNCSMLLSLHLGGNKFSGNLPSWLGESTPQLSILQLRSNLFSGNIPWELCYLQNLHILDLSLNKFSGVIPNCLGNLTAYKNFVHKMKSTIPSRPYVHRTFSPPPDGILRTSSQLPIAGTRPIYDYEQIIVVMKGRELVYSTTLELVDSIDLSGNNLTGEIPEEIASLSMLGTLNLSINHLNGSIPEEFGNLRWLETLDLSQNNLSGSIPQSLSSLTFLAHLNLSYNHLVGRIPSGSQFQTLNDASIYEGNPSLCGDPLPTKCPGDDSPNGSTPKGRGGGVGVKDKENGNDSEMPWFFVSIVLGFVIGFWGVYGTLMIKKSWRHAYFRFVDYIKDMIALWIALKVAHLHMKFGLEKN